MNTKFYIMEIKTLQDLRAFCETRYFKDKDVAFFWKMFEKGQTLPFCLNEQEFMKYYKEEVMKNDGKRTSKNYWKNNYSNL